MEENGARLNRDQLADAHRLIRVLAAADGPLRAREIHTAAEELAGIPVSWNTVKDCLHKNARRTGSRIERVAHGRYRHR
jgi:hypothetical protein